MSSQQNDNEQYSNDKKVVVSSSSGETNKNFQQAQPSYLFAFDFDHTIVSENSDVAITKLSQAPVPDEVKKIYDGTNWLKYMNGVFQFLHEQGVSVADICKFLRNMEPNKGMLPLLTYLIQLKTAKTSAASDNVQSPKVQLLIISDANDLFISEFLKARLLEPFSKNLNDSSTLLHTSPFDVITNNCTVTGNSNKAALSVSPYEYQTMCTSCPANLCKGSAVSSYIQSKGPFTNVFYTGDGRNDICPALKLSQHDFVFVRKNYSMYKMVQKSPNSLGISAKIVNWEDAEIIQSTINENMINI